MKTVSNKTEYSETFASQQILTNTGYSYKPDICTAVNTAATLHQPEYVYLCDDIKTTNRCSQVVITDVEILGEESNVVEVTFQDGKKEKAVCYPGDTFDLETGISICVGKYLAGGSSTYYSIIKRGFKLYSDKVLALQQLADNQAKEEAKRKRKFEKNKIRKQKKAERERQNRIQEQAEAYVLAQKMLLEENKK